MDEAEIKVQEARADIQFLIRLIRKLEWKPPKGRLPFQFSDRSIEEIFSLRQEVERFGRLPPTALGAALGCGIALLLSHGFFPVELIGERLKRLLQITDEYF